jgi:hypothetical protein
MVEPLIMLDNAGGVLDISVSNIDTNDCKLRYIQKKNEPILPGTLITVVDLADSAVTDVPGPARCNCFLGWCKAETILPDKSDSRKYIAVTGFRKLAQPEEYRIWVASEDPSELFEKTLVPNHPKDPIGKLMIPDPDANLRSLVIGKERDTDAFLWVLSQKGVYRKNIHGQTGLQPWNNEFMPKDVSLNKITVRPKHSPNLNLDGTFDDKIYIAGLGQKKGVVLHYQGMNWLDIFSNNEELNLKNKNLNGLWLGTNKKRVVTVGQSRTAIAQLTETGSPINRFNQDSDAKTLNTVTCIDEDSIQCWVAGKNEVYSFDNSETMKLMHENIWKSKKSDPDMNTVDFYASISLNIKTDNSGKYMVWIIGNQGAVLFFNGEFWRWLQVKERASGQDGENGQGVDGSGIEYRDIWAADEQNVWIVGSSGAVRVSDPTIPL